ncbi:MAG: Nif3-like dinuclear metal center hexameric protein [Flavobacteriales bacterium]
MKIKDITNYLETIAPLHLQESYDNSGLIIGDKNNTVNRALITLDCTEDVIDEAISEKCDLVIAHHPIVFDGLKKINGSTYIERVILKAIKNDIAIYAIHTNLDNILQGVNSTIAKRIGLTETKILNEKSDVLKKLVVFCPKGYESELKSALWKAGAGNISNYSHCSFSSDGYGTFMGNEKSQPTIGEKNKLQTESETKIELIFPSHIEGKILKEMFANHPYEEVAFEVYKLSNNNQNIGSGLIGTLHSPMDSVDFLNHLKSVMKTDCIRHTNLVKNQIKTVAVCGGSGSFLLAKAKSLGADIFISADFKYHQFFDAENDIIIADIGHYESEQFTKELINDILKKKFTKFATRLSRVNTNPINYLK